jgi:hypothetical protein
VCGDAFVLAPKPPRRLHSATGKGPVAVTCLEKLNLQIVEV